ncbi:unnamed protein product [Pedinophyceae sp. YPF-701]|nr:unnamed protein product [Pedinophyceae sp. YPF-701]
MTLHLVADRDGAFFDEAASQNATALALGFETPAEARASVEATATFDAVLRRVVKWKRGVEDRRGNPKRVAKAVRSGQKLEDGPAREFLRGIVAPERSEASEGISKWEKLGRDLRPDIFTEKVMPLFEFFEEEMGTLTGYIAKLSPDLARKHMHVAPFDPLLELPLKGQSALRIPTGCVVWTHALLYKAFSEESEGGTVPLGAELKTRVKHHLESFQVMHGYAHDLIHGEGGMQPPSALCRVQDPLRECRT